MIFHHGSTGRGTEPVLFGRPAPARRGRGGSQGAYDEGFGLDRSRGYTCEAALSLAGADRALRDLDAITPLILAQPFVDRSRVAVGGQSRGGILAVAWSGRQAGVPRAVVNFVGGWLGGGCRTASTVNQDLFKRGTAYDRPTI